MKENKTIIIIIIIIKTQWHFNNPVKNKFDLIWLQQALCIN